jgi:chorismate mutase/prephenate dehydratase
MIMESVGYLGGPAAFGYVAASTHFAGDNVHFKGYPTHAAVFQALDAGQIDHGVVAVENAIAGFVEETMRELVLRSENATVAVRAEVAVPVELRALVRAEFTVEQARYVVSHDMALRQCRGFLQQFIQEHPWIREMRADSTAAAAQWAADDPKVMAIASPRAQHVHPELIDHANRALEDKAGNQTRFFVLGPQSRSPQAARPSKTSALLLLDRNRPGSLARALHAFATQGINLATINPVPRLDLDWEYAFWIELESHVDALPMREVVARFQTEGYGEIRILGCYRNATTGEFAQGAAAPQTGGRAA